MMAKIIHEFALEAERQFKPCVNGYVTFPESSTKFDHSPNYA